MRHRRIDRHARHGVVDVQTVDLFAIGGKAHHAEITEDFRNLRYALVILGLDPAQDTVEGQDRFGADGIGKLVEIVAQVFGDIRRVASPSDRTRPSSMAEPIESDCPWIRS